MSEAITIHNLGETVAIPDNKTMKLVGYDVDSENIRYEYWVSEDFAQIRMIDLDAMEIITIRRFSGENKTKAFKLFEETCQTAGCNPIFVLS